MDDRRKATQPDSPAQLLAHLPAHVLLDRMPTPTVGVTHDGTFIYANLAFATMLGYADVGSVLAQPLQALLVGTHESAPGCVELLRSAGSRIVEWCHQEDFPIHTTVSSPLLLRETDPLLIINVTDITELLWVEASRGRRP